MKRRSFARIAALSAVLVLASASARAQRESGVDGATGGFDAITGTGLDTVVSVVVTIPDTESSWHCVATCSVEVDIAVADLDIDGRCALVRNGNEVARTDRRFELNNDPDIGTTAPINVATAGGMRNFGAGNHTIACACAKVSAQDANYDVNDSSIAVTCSDFALD